MPNPDQSLYVAILTDKQEAILRDKQEAILRDKQEAILIDKQDKQISVLKPHVHEYC
jgi:hypothetical protein